MVATPLAAQAYSAAQALTTPTARPSQTTPGEPNFAALVQAQLDEARGTDLTVQKAVTGGSDLLNVVTAVSETETTLQTLVAVRDKVIAAYEDVMRMAI